MYTMTATRRYLLACQLFCASLCLVGVPAQALVPADSTSALESERLAAAVRASDQGTMTAAALNQRLASTPRACVRNQPVHACSGVLVRPMLADHPVRFWEPAGRASSRGSENLLLLRSDRAQRLSPGDGGYVVMSGFDAIAVGKAYVAKPGAAPWDVQVDGWNSGQPRMLAVEALYYVPGQTPVPDRAHPLFRIQRSQLQWYLATGEWLPILRYSPGQGAAFVLEPTEQLYDGYQVADRINRRYTTVSRTCPDGKARYYCQGVWVRTTNTADVGTYRTWNPSPIAERLGAVSFSWFSADTSVNSTLHQQGFIMRESSYRAAQPLTLRCVYPRDASTHRTDDPCRYHGQCAALKITTKAAWLARYDRSTGSTAGCAFAADANAFAVLSDLRSLRGGANVTRWNELLIKPWPQNVPGALPLEAFIYVDAPARARAQTFQREYVHDTGGQYRPVLFFNATAPPHRLVTYNPEDQRTE